MIAKHWDGAFSRCGLPRPADADADADVVGGAGKVKFKFGFRGLYLYTGDVLFHVERRIKQL